MSNEEGASVTMLTRVLRDVEKELRSQGSLSGAQIIGALATESERLDGQQRKKRRGK